ncbi:respiratory chain complex I subunit 1 family protein [Pyrococcus kukulkanii]|uniref:NADH-quinone oxidoreductase subunit H n=1 Tax=Pyrococcus kukulkanii TaxID=1609559 RepID=A0A127BBB6_9EURY|nr:NADH-quinone oxidoreductase subunit H [Pyrococcus kukulkanii]AMM53946.1 hypothetical protein TQ32_05220 [Pyrococcus kukulkanii]
MLGVALSLLISPLFDGIARKIKARVQFRVGPPIVQTYYDIAKLLSLQPRIPTKNKLFVIAPYLALASALASVSVLPFGKFWVSFSWDVVAFIYALAMVSVFFMLGAFSVRSAFSHIGAHREMMLILSTEPILAVALAMLSASAGSLKMSDILSSPLSPLSLLGVLFLLYSVYVEGSFVPFDVAEAETEIAGGIFVEYSGKLLGVSLYALLIKRFALTWLLASILTYRFLLGVSWPVVLLVQFVVSAVIYSVFALIEATSARLRIDQIVSMNVRVFFLAIIAFIVGWFA